MSIETFTLSPTVDTAAYASGDLVGAKLTLSSILGKGNYAAMLESVVVRDRANQKSAFDVVFFDADPIATTFTDQSAFAVHANDMAKVIAVYGVAQADYVSISTTLAVATLRNVRLPLKNTNSTATLYAAVVCRGTPTYVAGTDLAICLTVSK